MKSHIVTVRKRSCGKVMFLPACVKNSVHMGGVQAPAQGGVCPGGVQAHAKGVSSQGGDQAQGVCVPACTEADTPSRQLLLRLVRILLQCILVSKWIHRFSNVIFTLTFPKNALLNIRKAVVFLRLNVSYTLHGTGTETGNGMGTI